MDSRNGASESEGSGGRAGPIVQEAPGRTPSCGLADAPHHIRRSGPLSGLQTLAGLVGEQRHGSVTCVKSDVRQ